MEEQQRLETEIIVVLDRSGSMDHIGNSTVEGFNTFLNEQQNADGEAFITLIQFDDRYEVDYKSLPVNEAKKLIYKETFVPRGTTALLDAIGKTIEELETKRDVIFVIITDGFENASNVYKREAIMKMIETKQEEGWKFLFLAANQDAIAVGGSIGIKGDNAMTWGTDEVSVSNTYTSFSKNIVNYRNTKFSGSEITEDTLSFSDEQRKDSKKS
jgi:hypothetical protein